MKFITIAILLTLITLMSCDDKGKTTVRLAGTEKNLPPELKGLKIYSVNTGDMNVIHVAIMPDGKVNSLTYPVGETQTTSLILNTQTPAPETRTLNGEILYETDEVVVIKKLNN